MKGFTMNKKTIEMYFGSSLYQAVMPASLFEQGMGNVILARKTAGGAIVGVAFLCDHYCLGVKDCFPFMENEPSYRAVVQRLIQEKTIVVEPATLKTYVTGLVQWAKEIGFDPCSEYRFCSKILRGIPADEEASFTYGKDGAPLYINGPHDTPFRIQQIMNTLEAYRERTGKQADFAIIG